MMYGEIERHRETTSKFHYIVFTVLQTPYLVLLELCLNDGIFKLLNIEASLLMRLALNGSASFVAIIIFFLEYKELKSFYRHVICGSLIAIQHYLCSKFVQKRLADDSGSSSLDLHLFAHLSAYVLIQGSLTGIVYYLSGMKILQYCRVAFLYVFFYFSCISYYTVYLPWISPIFITMPILEYLHERREIIKTCFTEIFWIWAICNPLVLLILNKYGSMLLLPFSILLAGHLRDRIVRNWVIRHPIIMSTIMLFLYGISVWLIYQSFDLADFLSNLSSYLKKIITVTATVTGLFLLPVIFSSLPYSKQTVPYIVVIETVISIAATLYFYGEDIIQTIKVTFLFLLTNISISVFYILVILLFSWIIVQYQNLGNVTKAKWKTKFKDKASRYTLFFIGYLSFELYLQYVKDSEDSPNGLLLKILLGLHNILTSPNGVVTFFITFTYVSDKIVSVTKDQLMVPKSVDISPVVNVLAYCLLMFVLQFVQYVGYKLTVLLLSLTLDNFLQRESHIIEVAITRSSRNAQNRLSLLIFATACKITQFVLWIFVIYYTFGLPPVFYFLIVDMSVNSVQNIKEFIKDPNLKGRTIELKDNVYLASEYEIPLYRRYQQDEEHSYY